MTANTSDTYDTSDTSGDKRIDLRPGLIGSAVALLVSAGLSVWGWSTIPDGARIPMHWNGAGEVDRYGSKTEALLTLPLVMAGICVLMAVLPLVLPRQKGLAGSARAYTAAWLGVLVLMTGLHAAEIINATGGGIPTPRIAIAGVGLLLVVLGNYLPKTRANWVVGVRTPWTLQSERSWRRTHRLAGWLFVGFGLLLLAFAFLLPLSALVPVIITGAVLSGVVPAAYSWWTWRGDPDAEDSPAARR
ncbi:SdpI family protein [Planomonospora corallina]|uniref:SdpI family protein n=1 Tax=Planomonospora corallina TaxID=1806052 RepID=A0ABV8I4Q0_9ACTN